VLNRFSLLISDNRIAALHALFIGFFFFSSCATTEDLAFIRQDVSKLQRDSLAAKEDINKVKEKTTGVAREESVSVMRESQAEIQSTLSNLSRDIQLLNGRFEENKYFVEKTLKNSVSEMDLIKVQITGIEGQLKDIKSRLSTLEEQVKQQKDSLKEQQKEAEAKSGEPQKEGQPEKTIKPADKTSRYEEAYGAFKNKKYKQAREKFEVFIKEFPKDELADNAHYWIAETYYNEKDFEGAILSYETFLKKYPDSQKAPGALYKQGLSFIEIGDKKTGKVILEQLIERYPKSREAELAKKQLEEPKKKNIKKKK
jgi:tol-pal system protein YbgF